MVQPGDTVTYTPAGGGDQVQSVDVSDVGIATVDTLLGAGGFSGEDCSGTTYSGGRGGRVQNVEINVEDVNTLYLWVADGIYGRYNASTPSNAEPGAGSTEISLSNTDDSDSSNEPVLVGAGGGGGSVGSFTPPGGSCSNYTGGDGARNGNEPIGGAGSASGDGSPGEGFIDTRDRISGGTSFVGIGSNAENAGEITISYSLANQPPEVVSGSESPTNGAASASINPTLSVDVTDPEGSDMDVTFYNGFGSQIGSTQTGISDGGTASVSWPDRDWGEQQEWYVKISDGETTTTSSDFTFTTTDGVPNNVNISDSTTENQLTVDWDAVSDAIGYYVYRAESFGSTKSDYTQIADVEAPPYVDTGLEDGEKYHYRVSSYANNG